MKTLKEVPKYLRPYVRPNERFARNYQDKLREQMTQYEEMIIEADTSGNEGRLIFALNQYSYCKNGIEKLEQAIADGEYATYAQCVGANFIIDWDSYHQDRKDKLELDVQQIEQGLQHPALSPEQVEIGKTKLANLKAQLVNANKKISNALIRKGI
jgi:hypothetical protein